MILDINHKHQVLNINIKHEILKIPKCIFKIIFMISYLYSPTRIRNLVCLLSKFSSLTSSRFRNVRGKSHLFSKVKDLVVKHAVRYSLNYCNNAGRRGPLKVQLFQNNFTARSDNVEVKCFLLLATLSFLCTSTWFVRR